MGKYTSLALDSLGHPHISYYDDDNDDLKVAHYDGSTWQTETVDGDGITGLYTSLVLDSGDQPHVSYCGAHQLKYAHFDGATWISETVDSQRFWFGYTSLALDSAGRPHISYCDDSPTANLKYATHDGSAWQIEVVDSAGSAGKFTSLALDSASQPHISYYDETSGSLKYATYDGSAWQIETVDQHAVGEYTSLAFDSAGRPHISYYESVYVPLDAGVASPSYDLKYAHHDGSAWQIETVDSTGSVGRFTSLALDSADQPHVSYYDETNGGLKYATYDGCAWQIETVDHAGDVGKYTSMALDAAGQPHISYYDDTSDDLKHASDVPLGLRRRAAQLIEEMRGTEMAPGWDTALLGTQVRPLYRPDVAGVAYYEFPVVVPAAAGLQSVASDPAGFIILSTDDHDFSVPHWDFAGLPPTEELAAKAGDEGYIATKFYKLDALAYAAEDEQGALVATLGEQPLKVTGMDPGWLDEPEEPTEATWTPDQQLPDDADAGGISGTLVISGPVPPPSLQLSEWASWDELKAGYSDSYGVLAESLHLEASEEWHALSRIGQDGEVLHRGDIRLLAMLWASPTVSLSGSGVGYVEGKLLARVGLPPVYQITVLDSSLGEASPLGVDISYPNGVSEQMSFMIVEFYTVWLPQVLRDSGGGSSFQMQSPMSVEQAQGWTPWRVYWAGNHSHQRLYGQIPSGTPPNTSNCKSGCGATAWAMLFGWADYQAAHGNAYWAPRTGLYRENGGYGAEVVAPKDMDDGVRNMIWEIRDRIKTFCYRGRGATPPWRMDNAAGYLARRSATRLSTHYSRVGIPWSSLRKKAISSIKDRGTPAVIGTGWLGHYPLAYGYKWRQLVYYDAWGGGFPWKVFWQRRFYVNQGWEDKDRNGWVTARTWFVGQIYP
jgi:hypothetical protein